MDINPIGLSMISCESDARVTLLFTDLPISAFLHFHFMIRSVVPVYVTTSGRCLAHFHPNNSLTNSVEEWKSIQLFHPIRIRPVERGRFSINISFTMEQYTSFAPYWKAVLPVRVYRPMHLLQIHEPGTNTLYCAQYCCYKLLPAAR